MANERIIEWEGASGSKYKYWIYSISTTFSSDPANYIFAKETKPGYFRPIYIGQTHNLSERFDDHHAMPCIKRQDATHIHAHKSPNSTARLTEERDLLAKWSPICNR